MDTRFAIFFLGLRSDLYFNSLLTIARDETEVAKRDRGHLAGFQKAGSRDPKRNYRVHEPMGSANADDER